MTFLVAGLCLSNNARAEQDIDVAVKAVQALAADSEKLQQYCAIVPANQVNDPAVSEEISIKLDEFFASLGPEYKVLTRIGNELAEGSKEEATLENAFDELERGCKR
jgi:hypothetical protein